MVFTGLRLAEAIGLTWNCVDSEKRRLTINKQLQKRPLAEGGFTFIPLKTDKTRAIAPAPFVLELLKRWRKVQAEERLKALEDHQLTDCSVLMAIFYDANLRRWFENRVDQYLIHDTPSW